jgi:hypothetical protein
VGAGDAADRGLSGQPLYGDASAETGAAGIAPVLRWGRLHLQGLLIWWLLWCTRPRYVLR